MLVSDLSALFARTAESPTVLILVLVDVGLGRSTTMVLGKMCGCLNPCFSGCWSRTSKMPWYDQIKGRLNPCFSGCWSRTQGYRYGSRPRRVVLILVLVDVGLGPYKGSRVLGPVEQVKS